MKSWKNICAATRRKHRNKNNSASWFSCASCDSLRQTVSFGLFLCLLLFASSLLAAEPDRDVLFREDFANLDHWKPFTFPNISRHSLYTIERTNAGHVLRTESNKSASAIVYDRSFDVYDYHRIRWEWKISNVYAKGNTRTKSGDDYPIRVYIMFEYDPARAGFLDRLTYGIAKKRFGEYPPHSSLSYVWASNDEPDRIVASPYTEKAKMVVLEKGAGRAGVWQNEEIDILDDYRKAFGTDPPRKARIAVMNDSDNTGEHSVSWLAWIEVFR